MASKSNECQYCNKDAATPGLPALFYQPGVRTNLEVTVLYTQVKVMVLLVVIVQLARDHWGSKPEFYGVRKSLIL